MRIKAGEGTEWTKYAVYLDGVKLKWCSEADDQEGWARYDFIPDITVLDEDGNPVMREEVKHGKVEFRPS